MVKKNGKKNIGNGVRYPQNLSMLEAIITFPELNVLAGFELQHHSIRVR